jgi:hypothetical protein
MMMRWDADRPAFRRAAPPFCVSRIRVFSMLVARRSVSAAPRVTSMSSLEAAYREHSGPYSASPSAWYGAVTWAEDLAADAFLTLDQPFDRIPVVSHRFGDIAGAGRNVAREKRW